MNGQLPTDLLLGLYENRGLGIRSMAAVRILSFGEHESTFAGSVRG